MKAGKEHRVPLSTAAIAVLQQMRRESAFIFSGRTHDTVVSDMSLTAVLRRMGRGDITVHGFRSTFRDWCAEAAGSSFPREVCEHALAHSLPNKVKAAYRRGDLLDKRILLMQAWADYCMFKLHTP
jgi:integrase